MALDPRIILAGQPVNALGALMTSDQAAANAYGFNRQREMDAMLKANGAGIIAGDQGALNALAGYSPDAAVGIQSARLGMEQTKQQMDKLDREEQRAVAAEAAKLSAAEREATAKQIEDAVKMGMMAKTPQEFDAIMTQLGATDFVGMFGQRQTLAARAMSVAEVYKMAFPEPAAPMSPEGKLNADLRAGLIDQNAYDTAMKPKGPDTVILGGGSDKQVYDTMQGSYDRASTAATGLNSLAEASKALDAGAITGFAADQRLALAKLGTYLGITDPSAVENTETFRAAIAPQVSALIKATVGSTNISNADREFAEKAAAGSITLDEGSIKRMIKVMEAMSSEAIRIHNEKVDKVYPDGKGYDRERALLKIDAPTAKASAPDSGSQALGLSPDAQAFYDQWLSEQQEK